MDASGTLRLGISGWRYAPWRGVFYPPELPQRRELEYASRCFPTIELNGSFYSLQHPDSWRRWHAETPDDFVFAIKGSRYVTHILRLRDCAQALANFFASGLLLLDAKLGPLLWQFPPSLRWDPALFEAFFALLPRTTGEALKLARRRDARLHGRSALRIDTDRPLRHAIEVRHPSFVDPGFVAQLRARSVALVVADTAGRWPLLEDVTSDFVYIRLHGDEELYVSGYTDAALDRWARRIAAWGRGGEPADARRAGGPAPSAGDGSAPGYRDVFCYFDNDVKVHAPFDANALARRLGASLLELQRPSDAAAATAAAEARRIWPGFARGLVKAPRT